MIQKPVALSLSPNAQVSDVILALEHMFLPWRFFEENCIKTLKQWFEKFFSVSYAIPFNSGRSALFATLKAIDVGKGDEVIIQAFTCVAVPNAVLALLAKPIYCDITSTLTIDPKEVEKKITKKTKAIIVQHTFGIPANMADLTRIAKENKIPLIEDCAHTIGGEYRGKKLGTFGTAAIFSFGRDKAFSSVFGGMAITNKKEIGITLQSIQKNVDSPSFFWVYQQLFHPVAFSLILPFYNLFSIGKILLVVLQKAQLLSFPVFPWEKKGKMDTNFVRKMPNALACLALSQLKKINTYNKRRQEISQGYLNLLKSFEVVYIESIPFLRLPILVEKRDDFISYFKKNNIHIGNWYSNVIDPKGVDFASIFYQEGSCPQAEQIAQKIVNLPTYPTMSQNDIKKVAHTLSEYVANRGN